MSAEAHVDGDDLIGTVLWEGGRDECAPGTRAGKDSSWFWGRGLTGLKMRSRRK